jgi:hypothetical protein
MIVRRTIFAIDPGPECSGWVLLDAVALRVLDAGGVSDNHDVLRWVQAGQEADVLALEMIDNMGMTVGKTTFDTVRWVGRYQQAWRDPDAVRLVYRRQVKAHLCNSARAKDSNIRQALLDFVGPPGTKREPGPTYGVHLHAWSALAVAVTCVAIDDGDRWLTRAGKAAAVQQPTTAAHG